MPLPVVLHIFTNRKFNDHRTTSAGPRVIDDLEVLLEEALGVGKP